jgi:DNA-binding transcriptional LysR family regulator
MTSIHDPTQLVALDALLETRSVSAAAKRMGVSQSAMSHTLARLRLRFADPLLVRSGRGLVPTARAEAMAPRLRAAVRELEGAVDAVPVFDPATARRTFRLATTDLVELVLLPTLLSRLEHDAPGVDLWLSGPLDGEGRLQRGDLDLSLQLLRGTEADAGLRARALFRERFVCVMRRDHPLAEGPLTLARFVSARHALVAPQGTPGGVVDRALEAQGLSRRTALTLASFLVVPHLVASSDLLVTLPERLARVFAGLLPLVVKEHPLDLSGFTVNLVWHERHDHDPGHRWLRQAVVAAVADAPPPEAPDPPSGLPERPSGAPGLSLGASAR